MKRRCLCLHQKIMMSMMNTVTVTAILWTFTQGFVFPLTEGSAIRTSVPLLRQPRAVNREPINYRLPDNVLPNHYEIKISPDMNGKEFMYHGVSKINISVKKPTTEITLHAKSLNIFDSIHLHCQSEKNSSEVLIIDISSRWIDSITDFLTIVLVEELSAGSECNLTLRFESTSESTADGLGLFEVSQSAGVGNEPRMVMTRFEPVHARRAFPCWDEPSFRAHFSISVEHDREYVALSNMHVANFQTNPVDPSRVITHFAQSPKMSTYLVAFVVGDIARGVENDADTFSVWARRSESHRAEYARKIGPTMMKLLDNYMDFPYDEQGFRKIDLVAVHNERFRGAMENWGLVIGPESKFLLKEESNSIKDEERLLEVMAHELAHQWLGDLVSPSWWDYLWLNEGFATFFEHIIVDQIKPSWRKRDRFVTETLQAVAFKDDDTIKGNNPMNMKRYSPGDIKQSFNSKNYEKAACVIRMISHVLGEENFQDRLRQYLRNQAFRSVTSDDLFKELAGGDESLLGFMQNWVTTPGFPVITVTRNYGDRTAIITQTRYLQERETTTEKYWVPLNYVTENHLDFNDTTVTHWLRPTEDSTEISQLDDGKFVIFNKQQFGYYRVNYDEENWELITAYLKTENRNAIHAVNRAQLINDAFHLVGVEKLKYDVALTLIEYLNEETDFIVWSAVWESIAQMRSFVKHTRFGKLFTEYMLHLSRESFERMILNNEDPTVKLYRDDLLYQACYMGSDLCPIEEALKVFTRWLEDVKKYSESPKVADWVLCSIGRSSSQEMMSRFWESFPRTGPREILIAIGCTDNSTILRNLLSETFNQKKTRPSNVGDFFGWFVLFATEEGVNVALDFVIQRYGEFAPMRANNNAPLRFLLKKVAMQLKSRHQLNKLLEFIKANEVSIGHTIDEISRVVQENIEIFEKREDEFVKFFSKHSYIQ